MKKQSNTPGHEAHPQLSYYGKALIVDHAWADARNQKVLLELDGLLFSVPLATARKEGGRQLDEGDLLPVEDAPTLTELWPLEGEAIQTRFWIILRETVMSWRHINREAWEI